MDRELEMCVNAEFVSSPGTETGPMSLYFCRIMLWMLVMPYYVYWWFDEYGCFCEVPMGLVNRCHTRLCLSLYPWLVFEFGICRYLACSEL